MDLTLSYLSDRDIEPGAQALIQQDVRNRLDYPEATVKLSRFPISLGQLLFRAGDSSLDRASQEMLDNAAGYLQQHRNLRLEILGNPGRDTQEDPTIQARITAIRDLLRIRKLPAIGLC